jgi:hypothetical protein
MTFLRNASLALAAIALCAASFLPSTGGAPGTSTAGSIVSVSAMLQPRSGHTSTLLRDGRVLIAGGMRRNQDFYRSTELFDPSSGHFQPAGDMNLPRVGHGAVLLNSGKVLIVGGWIGHACTDSAELYDPSTGKFTSIARMTTRRGQPLATLLKSGDVLITGGADRDTPGGVSSAEIFHPASLTFEVIAPMHYARISHTATLLQDGRVLIAGGRGDSVTASAELFDPASKTFATTGSMLTARYKHTAGLLRDGRVLIAGGSDERDWNGTTSNAEVFDPRSGKFTATSPLHASRFKLPAEAVQLPSGQLLVAGGSSVVEIFQPGTRVFLPAAGQLGNSWHFMTETLLHDGRVLLTGGYANNDQATNQAWLYQP